MNQETQKVFDSITELTPLEIIEQKVELKYTTLIEALEKKIQISKENEKATTVIYAVQHPHGEIKYLTPKDELTQKLWDQKELESKLAIIKSVERESKQMKEENKRNRASFEEEKSRRNELVEAKVRILIDNQDREYSKEINRYLSELKGKDKVIKEKEGYIKELLLKPSWNSFKVWCNQVSVKIKLFISKLDEKD